MAVLMKEKIIKICDLIMKGLDSVGIDLNNDEKSTNYLINHNRIVVSFFSEGSYVNSVLLMRGINMQIGRAHV